RLLRAEAKQHGRVGGTCPEFNPDLVNAYVERVLGERERAKFEMHLGACAQCRLAVVTLVRLASPEAAVAGSGPASSGADNPGLAGALRAFGKLLVRPQWALAGAAFWIVAIALPVYLSRTSQRAAMSRSDLVAQPRVESEPASTSGTGNQQGQGSDQAKADSQSGEPAESKSRVGELASNRTFAEKNVPERQAAPAGVPSSTPSAVGGLVAQATIDDLKKTEALQSRSAGDKDQRDQPAEKPAAEKDKSDAAGARGRGGPPAATPPATDNERQQQAGETQTRNNQLARIDEKQSQRLPQNEADASQETKLKQGRSDGEQRQSAKDATIRPEDAKPPAPPPTSSSEMRAKRGVTQAPKLSMREGILSDSAKAARPAVSEKKVSNKRFWLREDIWTDKDYNPLKEMPVVTIVRDSDVFREVTSKRTGLKQYFGGFGEHDRVIVVYKGTVYKLIPQASK